MRGHGQGGEVLSRCAPKDNFLRVNRLNEWPEGRVAARYQGLQSLYRNVLYYRISAGRCLKLHRAIGECEKRGYGQRAAEVALELDIPF